ncbi:MAG: glycoside hydrolase family 3 C-terminal domain-containing protein [Bacilli bacterium]|nr:glycoside hydrolase family 3 C-terminal domain-containing protein [Bacilli bacterium]
MAKKVGKIVQIAGMALLAGAVVAANIVASGFSEIISIFLGGFGNDFSTLNTAAGNEICQEIEGEGVVLLKNENGALPLDSSKKNADGKFPVAVFGWGATDGGFITSGSGSGGSAERGSGKLVSFLGALGGQEAMRDAQGRETLPAVEGQFDYYKPLIEMYENYKYSRDATNYWTAAYPFFNLIEPSIDQVNPLIEGAKSFSDTAFVVISRVGGEGQDIPRIQKKYDENQPDDLTRSYLELSTEEEDLLDVVTANFDNVVVIVNACNAMDLSFLDGAGIDAAISVSGGGQSGSVAITKILTGDINPSGRTVDAYAYDLSTAATYANAPDCREINGPTGGERAYTNDGTPYIDYAEGIYNGYRWYETADAMGFWQSDFAKSKWGVDSYEDVVQYPFGYGLSYSTFNSEIVSTSPANASNITPETEITVSVKVTNVGPLSGKEVVQLYYAPPYTSGGIEKSAVNLLAYGKTKLLAKDESTTLELTFKGSDMKAYDNDNLSGAVGSDGGYVLEQGEYAITLRSDSHTVSPSAGSTILYNVGTSTEIDGETVKNRFSNDGVASGDVAIDGTDTDEGITYLTRADFEGTFPTPRAARAKSDKYPANGWLTHERDVETAPTQGKSGDLKLYNSDGTLNLDLILPLGQDYDDPKWESLLDEITVDELYGSVQGGGFRTKAIPSINKPEHMDLDGPSGLNQEVNSSAGSSSTLWTSFPVQTVIAQSWNDDLSYRFGLTVGYEAYATGVAGWYAPAANIHRSPFDGRNFEYYSEDPLLSGKMCAATVKGATDNGLYCYVKHFAVNETELKREGLTTWLNEQSLREIYIRAFEITVKEGGANAIMSAFNRVGATWSGGNYSLLTGVLRDEWGFRGSVLTDYALEAQMSIMDINQGLRAGNDIWLNGLRTNTIGTINDRNGATTINCARIANKNILYTFCNTVYRQSEYLKNPLSTVPQSTIVSRAAASPSNAWVWILVGLDSATAIGIGIWIFFAFIRKKKDVPEA